MWDSRVGCRVDEPGGVEGDGVAEECGRVEGNQGTLAPQGDRHHGGEDEAADDHQGQVVPGWWVWVRYYSIAMSVMLMDSLPLEHEDGV